MQASLSPPDCVPRRKKRRRPALACEQCRRRKVRCDRRMPCSTCVRTNHTDCFYVPLPKGTVSVNALPKQAEAPDITAEYGLDALPASAPEAPDLQTLLISGPSSQSGIWANDETGPAPSLEQQIAVAESSPDDHSGPADFGLWQPVPSTVATAGSSSKSREGLLHRIRQLEHEVAGLQGQARTPPRDAVEEPVAIPGNLRYSRGSVSKTRFFGQSHWMNSADMVRCTLCKSDMLYRLGSIARKFETDETSQVYQDLRTCKNLGRLIKSRRTPKLSDVTIGQNVPPREVADALIANYLRTFETVHRVVHVPSFMAEYERYWQSPAQAADHFVVLMQLCMAIGAALHDDVFSLRAQATHWFWEATVWLMTPCEKSRMTMVGLQIRCLAHYARQTVNIGSDLTWIGAGSLLATAMYMGLHRDPKNLVKMSPWRAEMRRRLWVTILEICLQSSIDAGGSPRISVSDYDTEPPSNIDDELLTDDEGVSATLSKAKAKDKGRFTQMTIPLALFKTFPIRLAVAKRVNDFRSDTVYEETLRYSGDLKKSLQALMKELASHGQATAFQLRYVELMTHRLFFALHHPITPLAKANPMYCYSRMICLDIARRICQGSILAEPPKATSSSGGSPSTPPADVDFRRLTVNGSGSVRIVTVQSALVIGLDVINQKEAEVNNRPTMPLMPEPELRAIFDAYADWSRCRIRSGETNIKGHAIGVLLQAHYTAYEAGLDDDAARALFEGACGDRVTECLDLLREAAGVAVHEESFDELAVHDMDLDFDFGAWLFGSGDWDPMMETF